MSTISTLEACAIPLIIHNCPVTTGLNSQSNPGPWPVFHACYVFAPFPKSCAYQWVVVNADSLIPDLFIADLGESQTLPSGGPTSHDDTRSLMKAFILSDFQFFLWTYAYIFVIFENTTVTYLLLRYGLKYICLTLILCKEISWKFWISKLKCIVLFLLQLLRAENTNGKGCL